MTTKILIDLVQYLHMKPVNNVVWFFEPHAAVDDHLLQDYLFQFFGWFMVVFFQSSYQLQSVWQVLLRTQKVYLLFKVQITMIEVNRSGDKNRNIMSKN